MKVMSFFDEEVINKPAVSARFAVFTNFLEIFDDYDKNNRRSRNYNFAKDVEKMLKIFEDLIKKNPSWFGDFPFIMWFHFKLYS